MQTTSSPEQRVRIALALLQAREGDRPVRIHRLERELPDLERGVLLYALQNLCARRLARELPDGFLLSPPPVADDATHANAKRAWFH